MLIGHSSDGPFKELALYFADQTKAFVDELPAKEVGEMVSTDPLQSTDPSSMSTKDELEKLGEPACVLSGRDELEFCVKTAREKNSIQVVSPPTQEQTSISSPSTNPATNPGVDVEQGGGESASAQGKH